MCDVSVFSWLKNLRYDYEYYDPYDEKNFALKNVPEMDDSPYGHLWNCSSGFELKYAEICEESDQSVEFCDQLLEISPVNCVRFELPISEDVMLWQNQLRNSYCEEEQNILESQDVLTNFQISPESEKSYSPHRFSPTLHESNSDVQLRKNPNILQYRTSKTTDFELSGKLNRKNPPTQDFEAKGCAKLQLPGDGSMLKLKKNEFIKYQNRNLYKCDEENPTSMLLLRPRVIIKIARLLTRREVELKDANNLSYILIFDSSKSARNFMESDKIREYVENDNKSTVTKTLMRLLGKRSSREVLEKKGIYQNEPIFGNTLKNIFNIESSVPRFILKAIDLIEAHDNITSLGLYRTSGNLATIQKIRFEVDKGRLEILDDFAKDPDVLTGSLKLFFRELKEPLISCDICDKLLNLTKTGTNFTAKDKDKINNILNKLPEANLETLKVLIKHLVEVVKFKDQNKMDTYNLAVCWGPTVIFATDLLEVKSTKDLVTQSTEATKLFDSLLIFFLNNPEELEYLHKKTEFLDIHPMPDYRERSGSSVRKKGISNVDEVIKKLVELIEMKLSKAEGLYKNPGSAEKLGKLYKKVIKKKVIDIEKFKGDHLELGEVLKKYLQEVHEPLVTRHIFEQINKYSVNTPNLDVKVMAGIQDLPRKDTFLFVLQHVIAVLVFESITKVPRPEMISIWTETLNFHKTATTSHEQFSHFLKLVLDVLSKPKSETNQLRITEQLFNDLRIQQERREALKHGQSTEELNTSQEINIMEQKPEDMEETKL